MYRYKLLLLKPSVKALMQSSKVSIRTDHRGFLSLQFMIRNEDGQICFVEYYVSTLLQNLKLNKIMIKNFSKKMDFSVCVNLCLLVRVLTHLIFILFFCQKYLWFLRKPSDADTRRELHTRFRWINTHIFTGLMDALSNFHIEVLYFCYVECVSVVRLFETYTIPKHVLDWQCVSYWNIYHSRTSFRLMLCQICCMEGRQKLFVSVTHCLWRSPDKQINKQM